MYSLHIYIYKKKRAHPIGRIRCGSVRCPHDPPRLKPLQHHALTQPFIPHKPIGFHVFSHNATNTVYSCAFRLKHAFLHEFPPMALWLQVNPLLFRPVFRRNTLEFETFLEELNVNWFPDFKHAQPGQVPADWDETLQVHGRKAKLHYGVKPVWPKSFWNVVVSKLSPIFHQITCLFTKSRRNPIKWIKNTFNFIVHDCVIFVCMYESACTCVMCLV